MDASWRGQCSSRPRARTFLLLLAGTLGSCGSILGGIPFAGDGVGETTIQAERGEVKFWTAFDAQYAGELNATYQIELLQGGERVGVAVCDPLHLGASRLCSERILIGETHTIHCRMACGAYLPRSGPTTVRASFTIRQRPSGLRLGAANLIVRQ